MGGESKSLTPSSLDRGALDDRMGSQHELINIRGAQLHLIDGEESQLMTSGNFSLKLLKQSQSPLAVVVASVGEVQWPVGKDAPVLKVWSRRYTFALPGLVYGMILPDSTQVGSLQHLESILAEYSTFETHHEIAKSAQFASNGRRDDPGFWTAVAPQVETLSSRVARNIDSTSTIVASSIVLGSDWAALGITHGANSLMKRKDPDSPNSHHENHGGGGVSPRMMKRMQQARRMSAVAKLVSRTLLKGAISASGHVSRTLGFDMNGTHTSGPIYTVDEPSPRDVSVASVDAFGRVVVAVETAGKSLYDVTQKVGTDIVQERFGAEAGQILEDGLGVFGNVVNTAWTLNKMGVRMLLKMSAASAALNSPPCSGQSASSSSSRWREDKNVSTTASMRSMKQSRSAPELQHEISLSPLQSAQAPLPARSLQFAQDLQPAQTVPIARGLQSAQSGQPVPLNLLPAASVHSGQQLHTSQLFPTSAEQMRSQVDRPVLQVPAFVPVGNYTSRIPPGPRGTSPFQLYQHQHLAQQPQVPFSFHPRANMQTE